MKIKALLLASALLVAGVANAKNDEQYVTNSFGSNWYVGIGGGVNAYVGGPHGPFSVGPAVQVDFGKWFTPEFGARFEIGGINAGSAAGSYLIAGGDLLWNWSVRFGGYDPDRRVSVVPFLHADLKGKLRGAGAGAGMMFPIAINEKWSIIPEVRGVFYDENVFGTGTGRSAVATALVSVQYGIGKKQSWETKEDVVAPLALAVAEAEAAKAAAEAAKEAADARAAQTAAAKEAAEKENEALKQELDGAAADNEAIVKNLMNTPACVFFEIGQATLSVKELEHFDRIVKTMVSQGKNITFTVSGYSDKNTGSVRRNQQLAKQRANYIVKLLTGKYGLSADQFVVETSDCKTNKFTTIELNRAVIIEAAE